MIIPITRIAAIAAFLSAATPAIADLPADIGATADAGGGLTGMVGLALSSSPEYQGGDDSELNALPLLNLDYRDTAYFMGDSGGYWFWKPNQDFRVGALIKLRFAAWQDDDDGIEDLGPLPANFDEPDIQVEPGLNALYRQGRFSIEGRITSGEDLNSEISLGFDLQRSASASLTLQIGLEQLGEDTVNFNWYGDIAGADVDSATNVSLGLLGFYHYAEWSLIYAVQTKSFDDEIDDSLIVEEDSYSTALIGAAWRF